MATSCGKKRGKKKVLPPLLRYAQELVQGYQFDEEKTIDPTTFTHYDALVIGRDGYAKEFSAIFDWANIKDGCKCYTGD